MATFILVSELWAMAYALPSPSELSRFEFRQIHMGVETRIILYARAESLAISAADAAFERIAALEDVMSDYRPDSELMRLNAASGGPPVPVSDDLFFILQQARQMSVKTDGAFDVTIGPIVRLWREARRSGQLPSRQALEDARSRVGWEKMQLDEDTRSVVLEVEEMQLDLGGIGKGYAADEAMRILKGYGIESALIEMGGDIVVSGAPPERKGWQITVVNAPPDHSQIELVHRALSTSGDTEQFVEFDGVRYSHIVNPKTGLGLTDRFAVTVIAPDGLTSDAYATAVSVLGKEQGRELLERNDYVNGFIVEAEDIAP